LEAKSAGRTNKGAARCYSAEKKAGSWLGWISDRVPLSRGAQEHQAGYELVSFGMESLAPDTVVDGAIMDAPQVANAISRIFDSSASQDQERGHLGFRALGDREAGTAAVDERR